MVRAYVNDAALQPLLAEGAAALATGELAEFRRTGSMLLGIGEEDVAQRVPLAQGRGKYFPNDGVVDPAGLLATYLRGQEVRCKVAVHGWKNVGPGVDVETTAGMLSCAMLVNAAGPWAGILAGLPLAALNRHLFITPPMPEVDPNWPFVWDLPNGLYFRPESGGLLLCPCDEEERTPGDYKLSTSAQERLAELLARTQPRMASIAIRRAWTGQRTFAPDRRFVVGFDPRESRLFHVAGLGGHGVTASYAVGALAAKLILGAVTQAGDDPLCPSRLAGI
jgi:glycine/D-amino acid oxidase-like deaminating enzyme